MAIRKQHPEVRPWVESVAGLIGDPVKRLRFVRAVAPVAEIRERPHDAAWYRYGRVVVVLSAAFAILISMSVRHANARLTAVALPPPTPISGPGYSVVPKGRPAVDVWRVEKSGDSEVFSNGLRIDDTFAVSERPREYLVFPTGGGPPTRRSDPAGIVFHSTESRLAPFEAGHNEALKKIGESLLDYIRRRHSYHFLVDRFGRVYRVVAESAAANHAGFSAWADDRGLYVNLNESFFGVAFEAQTNRAAGDPEMTAAQLRSAVMLTEMLRAHYKIPAAACVTHAQVSVNPSNMRVGYHVDWASDFPFEELGLPNNYVTPLPAIWAFGFEGDTAFLHATGGKMRVGVESAGRIVDRDAAEAGLRVPAYRKRLQQQYREKLAAVRRVGSAVDAEP
jgi:hypothetical protein